MSDADKQDPQKSGVEVAIKTLTLLVAFLAALFSGIAFFESPGARLAETQNEQARTRRVNITVTVGAPDKYITTFDRTSGEEVSRGICPIFVDVENVGQVGVEVRSIVVDFYVAELGDLSIESDSSNVVTVIDLGPKVWTNLPELQQVADEPIRIDPGAAADERFYAGLLCSGVSKQVPRVRATVTLSDGTKLTQSRFVENVWCEYDEGAANEQRLADLERRLDTLIDLLAERSAPYVQYRVQYPDATPPPVDLPPTTEDLPKSTSRNQ